MKQERSGSWGSREVHANFHAVIQSRSRTEISPPLLQIPSALGWSLKSTDGVIRFVSVTGMKEGQLARYDKTPVQGGHTEILVRRRCREPRTDRIGVRRQRGNDSLCHRHGDNRKRTQARITPSCDVEFISHFEVRLVVRLGITRRRRGVIRSRRSPTQSELGFQCIRPNLIRLDREVEFVGIHHSVEQHSIVVSFSLIFRYRILLPSAASDSL